MLEHVALYRYIVKTVLCEGGGAEMHPAYIRLCIYIYTVYMYIHALHLCVGLCNMDVYGFI